MVQNLIRLTYNNRKKIANMCVALLPRVGYARVTRSGTVILKKSFWSLFRKRIPVTDIIIKYIPAEIGKLVRHKQDQAVYVELFNYQVSTIVSLTKFTPHLDLFAYVYKEYAKNCLMVEDESIILVDYKEPIAPKIQSFGIGKYTKNTEYRNSHKLSDRIQKLKNKISDNPITAFINLRLTTN